MRVRGLKPDDKGKDDNADHIINDGGADNRCTYLAFDFA